MHPYKKWIADFDFGLILSLSSPREILFLEYHPPPLSLSLSSLLSSKVQRRLSSISRQRIDLSFIFPILIGIESTRLIGTRLRTLEADLRTRSQLAAMTRGITERLILLGEDVALSITRVKWLEPGVYACIELDHLLDVGRVLRRSSLGHQDFHSRGRWNIDTGYIGYEKRKKERKKVKKK